MALLLIVVWRALPIIRYVVVFLFGAGFTK